MRRLVWWTVSLALTVVSPLHAQDATALNDLKAKIWEAELAQRNFGAGVRYCGELNGSNFYFQPGDRVLDLENYHRSLDNLVSGGALNPETKRPKPSGLNGQIFWRSGSPAANCAALPPDTWRAGHARYVAMPRP